MFQQLLAAHSATPASIALRSPPSALRSEVSTVSSRCPNLAAIPVSKGSQNRRARLPAAGLRQLVQRLFGPPRLFRNKMPSSRPAQSAGLRSHRPGPACYRVRPGSQKVDRPLRTTATSQGPSRTYARRRFERVPGAEERPWTRSSLLPGCARCAKQSRKPGARSDHKAAPGHDRPAAHPPQNISAITSDFYRHSRHLRRRRTVSSASSVVYEQSRVTDGNRPGRAGQIGFTMVPFWMQTLASRRRGG